MGLFVYIYIYIEREIFFGKVWCVFGRSNLGDTDANASFFFAGGAKLGHNENEAGMYIHWSVCFPKPSCKNLNVAEELLYVFWLIKNDTKGSKELVTWAKSFLFDYSGQILFKDMI